MKTQEIEDENQNVSRNWERLDAVNFAQREAIPTLAQTETMQELLLKKIRSETTPSLTRQSQSNGANQAEETNREKNRRLKHR